MRSHRADADVALVELNNLPATGYGVHYAARDASGATTLPGIDPAGAADIIFASGFEAGE